MSDRVSGRPDAGAQLDDVSAVLDAPASSGPRSTGGARRRRWLAACSPRPTRRRRSAVLHRRRAEAKWAPDYPWGTKPRTRRSCASTGSYADLGPGRARARDRPAHLRRPSARTAPGTMRPSCAVHARLARFATTPGELRGLHAHGVRDRRPRGRPHHPRPRRRAREGDAPRLPGCERMVPPRTAGSAHRRRHAADLSSHGVAEYNASLIPGARLVTVPGAAVIPFFDQEEAYADAMIAFIDSVQARGGRPRPHAGDGPVHRHRRLDRQGLRARRRTLDGAARDATTPPCAPSSPATAATRSRRPATASSPPSTGPARAVKCAQAICEAVKPLGLEVRAGCHTGEIELLGADVGGIAVHIGARVARPRRPLRGPRHLDGQGPRRRLRASSSRTAASTSSRACPDRWHLYAVRAVPH